MIFQRFGFGLMLILSESFATPFLVDSQEHEPFKYSTSSDHENDLFEQSQIAQSDKKSHDLSDDNV